MATNVTISALLELLLNPQTTNAEALLRPTRLNGILISKTSKKTNFSAKNFGSESKDEAAVVEQKLKMQTQST